MLGWLRRYAVEFRIDYDALEIKDKIGDGGYGTVYKAIWKSGHIFCAVKLLKPRGGADDSSAVGKGFERVFTHVARDFLGTQLGFGEQCAEELSKQHGYKLK